MTVRVNDVVGVAGFALPGNYVDVMVSAQQDRAAANREEENEQISKTVLTNVLVLAVAQEAGGDDTKPKVVNAVTLELTPEDAEKLDLARNVGTFSLVLRNQIDKANKQTPACARRICLARSICQRTRSQAAAKLRAARVPEGAPLIEKSKVEVIRGVQRSNAELGLASRHPSAIEPCNNKLTTRRRTAHLSHDHVCNKGEHTNERNTLRPYRRDRCGRAEYWRQH